MQHTLFGFDEPQNIQNLIASFQAPAKPEPLHCSMGVAKAALQKAIRRGELNIALRSAAMLMNQAPDQLWRRLCGIAMEDVGFGDWQTVEIVTRLARSKRERNRMGDDWKVAAFAVDSLCNPPKCRAADDLLMVSNRHQHYALHRSRVRNWTDGKRLEFIVGAAPLIERAIAATSFLLAESTSPYWSISRERASRLLGAFFNSGVPANVVETADRSFRVTGEHLPFTACLIAPLMPKAIKVEVDPISATAWINGTPNWALDLFSAEGRKAIQQFLTFDCPSANTIRTAVPASKQIGVFGHLLFRVEGQLCRKRRRWKVADDLRSVMDHQCHAPYFADASHILRLIIEDLPLINLARHEVSHG
jgi:hypothetical protein